MKTKETRRGDCGHSGASASLAPRRGGLDLKRSIPGLVQVVKHNVARFGTMLGSILVF